MIGLFDIGGTHTRTAICVDGKSISGVRTFETPQDFDAAMKAIAAALSASAGAFGSAPFSAITGGAPGTVEDGVIVADIPHLPAWQGRDVKAAFSSAFPKAEVSLENDADMACLGEAVFGAGRGFETVAYMTVSTGIGGGRVAKGAIDHQGRADFKPGRIILDAEKNLSLEDLASGSGVLHRLGKRVEKLDESELAEIAGFVARGVAECAARWSPDVFVLGGSIVLEVDGFYDDIAAAIDLLSKKSAPDASPKIPVIKKAALGDQSGLYGALKLALPEKP